MKILTLTNKLKVDIQDDFNKAFAFIKENIPNAEFDLTSKQVSFRLEDVRPNTIQYHDQYSVVIYAFDDKSQDKWNSDSWLQTARLVLIELCTGKEQKKADYIWKDISHELMHAFCKLTNTEDVMDTYLHNDEPRSPDGNFARQFKLLRPNIYKLFPPMNTATIQRSASTKKQTLGKLTATNGSSIFSCNTLELPWLGNKSNVSCIPKGIYDVIFTTSKKFPNGSYEVQKVLNRSGIRLHVGNYYNDIEGCILLGTSRADINKDGEIDVTNSKVAVTAFEGFFNRKPFTLIIT